MKQAEILYEVTGKDTDEKHRERQGRMIKAYHQGLKSVQRNQKKQ